MDMSFLFFEKLTIQNGFKENSQDFKAPKPYFHIF